MAAKKQTGLKVVRQSKAKGKDPIDALVDNLDKYYFRMGSAENMLGGSCWIQDEGWVDDVRGLFETPTGKEHKDKFYEIAKEAEAKIPGISERLEDAFYGWQSGEETFPMLLGFIIGLRIAGMSSDQTKRMARTWRLGYPQDDKELKRRAQG